MVGGRTARSLARATGGSVATGSVIAPIAVVVAVCALLIAGSARPVWSPRPEPTPADPAAAPAPADPAAVTARRSTGPSAGEATTGGADAVAQPVSAAVPARVAPRPSCPWTAADRATVGPEKHRRVIELTYCALLGRAPDADGIAYWAQQLEAGLTTAELVVEVGSSPEYRRGRVGRDRWTDSPVQALAALGEAGRAGSADRADPDTESASGGLRERLPITAAEFDRWVAGRGLAPLDRITDSLVHGRLDGDRQRVNVVYVHRSATRDLRVSPGDRGRATVGSWAAEIGADVAINGNWYAPWDGPAVSGGRVYGGTDHGYTALFGVTADGDVVVEHHREVNDRVDPRVVEGVSGHPTLIHRGRRTTDFGTDPTFLDRNPRTAIGLDASGDILILVTVDGRSSRARGMTGDETARLLERLGADDAVMLDGGGSTTMWIAGRGVVNRPSGRLRAVGNQVAAFGS